MVLKQILHIMLFHQKILQYTSPNDESSLKKYSQSIYIHTQKFKIIIPQYQQCSCLCSNQCSNCQLPQKCEYGFLCYFWPEKCPLLSCQLHYALTKLFKINIASVFLHILYQEVLSGYLACHSARNRSFWGDVILALRKELGKEVPLKNIIPMKAFLLLHFKEEIHMLSENTVCTLHDYV